ncbi:hypothetical protein AFA91_13145 [Mycolicibacterium goodii]|uniref:Uncharacterized protein n=1 Tax=Mycolicibacterium goodii TaxID=134601 RepID=A0A0K0X5L1_MYCGD|nr:hypothetical protein AFA91_13145 [Mycolicibacterium goodii]
MFVPNDEVKVAAVAPAPDTKSMTVEQLKLLASLQQISDAFFQGYGGFVTPDANNAGDCDAEGAVCPGGFVGVPYLLIDEALPNTLIDNYFFETGFVGTAQYILESAGVDPTVIGLIFDPVGTISDLVAQGVATATGENSFISGLTTAFLIDYQGNLGFVGAINYIVDTIIQGAPPLNSPFPEEEEDGDEPPAGQLMSTTGTEEGDEGTDETAGDVSILASTTETQQGNALTRLARTLGAGPASTEIGTGTLVDVNTETEQAGEESEEPGTVEVGLGTEEETDNSGTEVTAPVANTGGTTTVDPAASEGETGTTTPTGAEEVKTEPVKETEPETETVDTKNGNKATPGVIWQTGGGSKSPTNGWEKLGRDIQNGVNTLNKIFNKGKTTPKPAADTEDSGADNGGSEGGGEE